jgi:hypothetical protein
MVTSDRSTAGLRAADWLVYGHPWPPGQLPPATDHLRPAPPASATRQARMGGLLAPLADVLLGQRLA